jgi:hypothetical protein
MHFSQLTDLIGLIGVFFCLLAYFLLQTERIKSDAIPYSLYNTLGALLIVFSLRYKWNLSAFVMEGAWFLLSIYGLYKACKMYKRKKIKK